MSRSATKKSNAKPRPKRMKPAATTAERPEAGATGYVVRARVSHPKFGDGTVTAVDAEKLTIRFRDGRVKQILDYYVKRRDR